MPTRVVTIGVVGGGVPSSKTFAIDTVQRHVDPEVAAQLCRPVRSTADRPLRTTTARISTACPSPSAPVTMLAQWCIP